MRGSVKTVLCIFLITFSRDFLQQKNKVETSKLVNHKMYHRTQRQDHVTYLPMPIVMFLYEVVDGEEGQAARRALLEVPCPVSGIGEP